LLPFLPISTSTLNFQPPTYKQMPFISALKFFPVRCLKNAVKISTCRTEPPRTRASQTQTDPTYSPVSTKNPSYSCVLRTFANYCCRFFVLTRTLGKRIKVLVLSVPSQPIRAPSGYSPSLPGLWAPFSA
jgi:hypothetical protein